ncbi:MAG: hypothetical protein ACTHMF_12440 [Leifsonia sp.]|uniref:hypothetical protein n=1 Tax=Leifsonia sp. TaxID=1870902 RepID=UPI003F803792
MDVRGDTQVVEQPVSPGATRLSIALGILAVLCLAGCTPGLRSADVPGDWIHQGTDAQGAQLRLEADGHASGSGLPPYVLFAGPNELDPKRRYSFEGMWKLRGNHVELDLTQVTVDGVTKGSASSQLLYTTGTGDSLALHVPLGDPDDSPSFTFVREHR